MRQDSTLDDTDVYCDHFTCLIGDHVLNEQFGARALLPYDNINLLPHVRFEVFTAVIMKNAIILDVTQCGSSKK
jgi:hypothetical protein